MTDTLDWLEPVAKLCGAASREMERLKQNLQNAEAAHESTWDLLKQEQALLIEREGEVAELKADLEEAETRLKTRKGTIEMKAQQVTELEEKVKKLEQQVRTAMDILVPVMEPHCTHLPSLDVVAEQAKVHIQLLDQNIAQLLESQEGLTRLDAKTRSERDRYHQALTKITMIGLSHEGARKMCSLALEALKDQDQ